MDNKQEDKVKTENVYNQQMQLLLKIQELEFTAIELNLYLDTHPDDQQALNLYNSVVPQLRKCIEAYEQYCGPLFHFGMATSQYPWQWINSPWPWEM
ncbi:spore coat protein CotJB [Pelotomaculum terephthalicicum JT]|uniref:spore coat protein CotJB n=1 Tax=Pelotomaculum TaxID=191373 RepID=UPI0009C8BE1D|nr:MULTISPECIES: spore coat protein CotJB [Pelotomaculum]MCG9968885.1 spore coat protein CotJB [Pelotomaculum terephthalicicum JT]OPX87452.1 MAG: CotJB protein [Pelotomaculum sp. PtaB.Bin117]OPY61583.1 MAG: CotJB protein [Pelotomaculum sp. PtaU1.Bin065]